jgi:hypothetical protein
MKTLIIFLLTFNLTNISLLAQVGIGGTPDPATQMDIQSADKGILIPRINLSDATNQNLDGTNQAPEGLLIYNTNDNITNGNGKGFYVFNGTKWTKLIPQSDNITSICIDTNQMTITNTSGSDVSGYDTALEPIFFNKNGQLQVKLIVRYSAINGNAHFQLRASDDSGSDKWPIVVGDSWTFSSTQTGGIATSNWKDWSAGTHAHEIHLNAWVDNGASVTIESAYILVRSQ